MYYTLMKHPRFDRAESAQRKVNAWLGLLVDFLDTGCACEPVVHMMQHELEEAHAAMERQQLVTMALTQQLDRTRLMLEDSATVRCGRG